MVKMMMAKAGIKGYFTHHSLRATAVSRLPQEGVNDKLIRCYWASIGSPSKLKNIYIFAVRTSLTCSQRLSCGGTREVRSDVSMEKHTLAATSVHVLITPRPPRPMTTQVR